MRLSPLGCALTLLLIAWTPLHAQAVTESDPSTSGPLYDDLARMDSLLFDAGFVTCNADKVNSFFSDDVEFYHDRTGLESGQQVRDTFKRLTASCPGGRGIRREIVAGSLRVYPMQGYGAIQMGLHRFVERGTPTHTVARFVHLWQQKDGRWKITRVLSFDHLARRDESGSLPSRSTP
jgi:ketosteroid isomerase-like protein